MTVRALALAAAALLASSAVVPPLARAVARAPIPAAAAVEPASPGPRVSFQARAASLQRPPAGPEPATAQPAGEGEAPRSVGAWLVWIQDHLLAHGFLV